MSSTYIDILNRIEPITLADMDRVSLMERIDSKYVFHINQLPRFLEELKDDYQVLDINSTRISRYESLYFDTPDFALYHFHQRGKFNRFKFRIRKYVESNLFFFEIKFKNNKGRTYKNRIINNEYDYESNELISDFLQKNTQYGIKDLEQKIRVDYSRITLVNRKIAERVTIDLNLTFLHEDLSQTLETFVIAEVKQNKSSISPFVQLMHKNHVREGSISKYCLGVMNLFPHLRANNFKPFQNNLKKIIKTEEQHVYRYLSLQASLFSDKHSIEFLIRLAINLISCLVLIRFIYYPIYRNREYFFTFIIFNLLIFIITILLNKVEMSMGAAFGLFAVFSMLRYRTEGLSMKDMTYLFLVIAMGLVTAVGAGQWWEISLLNIIVIGITYLLESNLLMKKEHSKIIQYENIELIKPGRQSELKMDLESRTGLKINRIDINSIDFLKDTALITVHYHD